MKKLFNTLVLLLIASSLMGQFNLKKLKDKAKSKVTKTKVTKNDRIATNSSTSSERGEVFKVKQVDLTTIEEAPDGTLAPGAKMFVGVGYPSMNNTQGIIMTTKDGQHWEEIYRDPNNSFSGVAYGKGKIVAVGGGIVVSADGGETWKSIETAVNHHLKEANFRAVCYGNGLFLAVGSTQIIAYSKDGENWVRWHGATVDPDTRYGSTHLHGVFYYNNKFYVLGNRARIVTFRQDEKEGIILEKNVNQGQIMTKLLDMAYGNGNLVAVGTKNDYISTDDGNTWNITSPEWQNWGITFGKNKFVKACGFGRLFTSETGKTNTWKETLYVMRSMFFDVAFGNDRFVATGKNGVAYYSNDGENWNNSAITPSHTIKSILYIP